MILRDFTCTVCGYCFEDLVNSSDETTVCTECGEVAERKFSAPRIGLYNDPAARQKVLMERSHAHSVKEISREPEKHGLKSKRQPWNVRSTKAK